MVNVKIVGSELRRCIGYLHKSILVKQSVIVVDRPFGDFAELVPSLLKKGLFTSIFLTSKACQDKQAPLLLSEKPPWGMDDVNRKKVLFNMCLAQRLPEKILHWHRRLRECPLPRFHAGCFH